MFETIKNDINTLRQRFTFRAFLFLLFGFALLSANGYFFFLSILYAFKNFDLLATIFTGLWGTLGFLLSCLLIFCISLNHAVTPQNELVSNKMSGGTIFSEARKHRGKGRGKKLAVAILIYTIIFIVGIVSLTYYVLNDLSHSHFVAVEAEVVGLNSAGYDDDDGYTCRYRYFVNGQAYEVNGHVESSGAAAPMIGDIVIIRYNPDNPQDVYLASEEKFFLGFGMFFLYIGILLFLFEFVSAGYLSTQLFLAYILIGLTAVVFLITFSLVWQGIVHYLARNLWMHFVMIFGNTGMLMLFEGIVDFKEFYRQKRKF